MQNFACKITVKQHVVSGIRYCYTGSTMLTQKDLQAIGALIKTEVNSLDEKIGTLDQTVKTLGQKVETLDQKVGTLDQTVKTLGQKVETLDMKIETSYAFSKEAHAEIMEKLIESNEIIGQQTKAHEKRIERLEDHTGLTKTS